MAKKKETALHRKLAEELQSLMGSLDEEGLAFLVEQARVHLHNMEVDRLLREEEAAALEAESVRVSGTASGKGSRAGKGSAKKAASGESGTGDFRIERSGSSYHVISAGKWKMFSEDEMLAIVKICRSKDPVEEVSERLYRWLEAERPDAFPDLEIGGRHDVRLRELAALIGRKFAIRE
jgi:hypothetical protein